MRTARIAFVALALILGSNFIYMKWAAALISAPQIAFLRVLCGLVPLVVMSALTRAITRRQLRQVHHHLLLALLLTALPYFAFAQGTARLPSAIAGLLSGSIPLFTFLCALLLLRAERPNLLMAAGVVLGLAGIVLAADPWGDRAAVDLIGAMWMLAGALSAAMGFVYARRFLAGTDLPPVALSTWQTALALPMLFIATPDVLGSTAIFGDVRASIGLIVGAGALGTGIAYVLNMIILERMGAVAASSVMYLPPVVALTIGLAVGEPISIGQSLSVLPIVVGVAALQIGRQRAANVAPPATTSIRARTAVDT